MNKKLIALLCASVLLMSSMSTAMATINTQATETQVITLTEQSAQTTSPNTIKAQPVKFDTTAWTEEEKMLLDIAKNKNSTEATRSSILNSLVAAGLISQEKADLMKFDSTNFVTE